MSNGKVKLKTARLSAAVDPAALLPRPASAPQCISAWPASGPPRPAAASAALWPGFEYHEDKGGRDRAASHGTATRGNPSGFFTLGFQSIDIDRPIGSASERASGHDARPRRYGWVGRGSLLARVPATKGGLVCRLRGGGKGPIGNAALRTLVPALALSASTPRRHVVVPRPAGPALPFPCPMSRW